MSSKKKRSPTSLKVAILDNSIDPAVYKPIDHWRQFLSVPWESFRALDGQFPDLASGLTHLILTGSEASIVQREPWVAEEVEVVKEALARGFPVLGSCYGHQLLVLALRGPAHVRRCPQPEIGWIPIKILRPNGLLGKPRPAYSFSIHFDEVINLDDGFSLLASTPACSVQAFKLKGQPVWGIQFHPEIDVAAAQELLGNLLKRRTENNFLFEQALAATPRDSGLIRRIVHHFLAARRQV